MAFEKSHPITDTVARYAWAMERNCCAVCHVPAGKSDWRGLSVHHLIHGAGNRSDEPCNLLLLCGRCHDQHHAGGHKGWPDLTLGMLLKVKRETDFPEWDAKRLKELYHRELPPLEALPKEYRKERERWDPAMERSQVQSRN